MNVLYKKQQNCLVDRASESCGNNPGSLPEGATILEKINGKPRPHLPPTSRMGNGAFLSFARLHPWFGGDGGLLFNFILPKIVGTMNVTM